ncbi:microcin C ABC transporter permease YejB [Labrys sp. LIt4]|uniref:Microcin ABC transporter permease n=1 Tax=Labrys okinawensis TaxID=346911 RepID=A0A2S9QG64_9HYPH|nr:MULTISPECIES: microcin C ABC transporter permease YejB [Labrys]MBP0579792.1 microcin C ABC transporter permease YejB [Labrys sp. LIt4]PRH88348.1 microcin ABC transporter permease [Labrys okinawensis]
MLAYVLRRLALIVPTLFGIMLISFAIIQIVPGGPVERMVSMLSGNAGGGGDIGGPAPSFNAGASQYRGSQGLDPAFIASLRKQYGFDKPVYEQFWLMIKNYATFNFGQSYFRDTPVTTLIAEKLPVSISIGLWVMLLSYAISIPLGIRKAIKDGSFFDGWTSAVIIVGYAIPGFTLGILLITLFAGSAFWQIFPNGRLVSDNWNELSLWGKIADYAWHMTLPLIAMGVSAFATLTMMTKNAFLDEIRKQYVLTARMKGLSPRRVLYGHVFRNAMLIVIASFPAAFISALFTGSLLIEQTFELNGLGRLNYESVVNRDYPVVLASIYILALVALVINLATDLIYMFVDPRIDFEAREV